MNVAVLGTGTIGAPMARNIAAAGKTVRAWNRTAEKAQGIEGVEACASAAGAVAGADLVITVLADGAAVEEVIGGVLDALPDGCAWLQMSTVGIAANERLATLAEERGIEFVDAPVVGTRQPAEQGKLIVLASGPRGARERAQPVFDAIASKVVDLGDAGEGTRLKLVLNAWLVALVEGLAETVAFAEAIGVDPNLFLDAIDGAPVGAPYAQLKGKMMLEREFPEQFKLTLARKDAALVLEAADRHDFEAPLTTTVVRQLDRAIEAGHGDDDMAAAYYAYGE